MKRDAKKDSTVLFNSSKKVKAIEENISKKLGVRVSISKCKITKTTLFPTIADIDAFGDDAMPVVIYDCKLKYIVNGELCKVKTKYGYETEDEAIKSAINKIVKQNDSINID